jgi:hypothetical protein
VSTSTPTYITEAEAKISVTLAGVTFPAYLRTWRTFEGGDPVASTGQLQPGGVNHTVAVPGVLTRSNVTVTTPYSTQLDAIRAQIDAACNAAMSVSYTPTDANGNPNGETTTYTGILKQPQFPPASAASADTGMLGLVMECNYP